MHEYLFNLYSTFFSEPLTNVVNVGKLFFYQCFLEAMLKLFNLSADLNNKQNTADIFRSLRLNDCRNYF